MDNGRMGENMTFWTALKRASYKLMMPHRVLVKYSYHVSNVLHDTGVWINISFKELFNTFYSVYEEKHNYDFNRTSRKCRLYNFFLARSRSINMEVNTSI